MTEQSSLVIDTQNLTKTFKGVNALQALNLRVPKNSIFGFLGPNGAGKTTTIKLLLGLSHLQAAARRSSVWTSCVKVRKFVGVSAISHRIHAITRA